MSREFFGTHIYSSNITQNMTTIFQELTKLAQDAGVPLTMVADMAGVPRTTLWDWRNKLPRTLQHYENLRTKLGELTQQSVQAKKDQPDQPTPPNQP